MKSVPLYIHVPFCRHKCGYCTFYSTTSLSEELEHRYIRELIRQIGFSMDLCGADRLKTIYLGGGTPSSLSTDPLGKLFDFLYRKGGARADEFTMECNPEDINGDFISFLNDSPVDRISLGIQSFRDDVLQKSGRLCRTAAVKKALNAIRRGWGGRFSIDLISGLPGQTTAGQKEDLRKALDSGADHISCYSLIVDDKAPIASDPSLPDSSEEEVMWEICRTFLMDAGFVHYEVSNFARPGMESLHNIQYWEMNEYLGCGPGAVGMLQNKGIVRMTNPSDLNLWLQGKPSQWNVVPEKINSEDFLFENYMMGLRMEKGLSRSVFKKRFGYLPEKLIAETIGKSAPGTFGIEGDRLFLSEDARLFMNSLLLSISDELERLEIDFKVVWP